MQGTVGATRNARSEQTYPSFLALGYDCTAKALDGRFDPTPYQRSGRYCRTTYYFRLRIERRISSVEALSAFWTVSASFHTPRGSTPGMSQTIVDHRERGDHGIREIGCHTGIYLTSPNAHMLLPNWGGHLVYRRVKGTREAVDFAGGRLEAIGIESTHHPVALLSC